MCIVTPGAFSVGFHKYKKNLEPQDDATFVAVKVEGEL